MTRVFALLAYTGKYQIAYSVNLQWRCWDDEYVVFDETSGHTHQLDPVRAFVLNFLGTGSYQFEVVLSELTSIPAFVDAPKLSGLLQVILGEFSTHGLVEIISS